MRLVLITVLVNAVGCATQLSPVNEAAPIVKYEPVVVHPAARAEPDMVTVAAAVDMGGSPDLLTSTDALPCWRPCVITPPATKLPCVVGETCTQNFCTDGGIEQECSQ